jgi:hypothetical protein
MAFRLLFLITPASFEGSYLILCAGNWTSARGRAAEITILALPHSRRSHRPKVAQAPRSPRMNPDHDHRADSPGIARHRAISVSLEAGYLFEIL